MKKTTPYDRFSNYLNNIDLDVQKVVISASALYLSFIIMHTFWDGDPKAEAYIMELSTKILTLAIAVIWFNFTI